jgi:hypothetical protein
MDAVRDYPLVEFGDAIRRNELDALMERDCYACTEVRWRLLHRAPHWRLRQLSPFSMQQNRASDNEGARACL